MKKKIISSGFLAFIILINVNSQSKISRTEYAKDSIPSLIVMNTEVAKYKHSDGIKLIKECLDLSTYDNFKTVKLSTDEMGFTHERFQHYYQGLLVEFSQYNVHSYQGEITSISGNLRKVRNLDVNPVFSEVDALNSTLKQIGAKTYMWENKDMEELLKKQNNDTTVSYYPKGELIIWTDWDSDSVVLAYKFKIYSFIPYDQNYIYVDARTGQIFDKRPLMIDAVGTADTRYCASQSITTDFETQSYRLLDETRNIQTLDLNTSVYFQYYEEFTDDNNNWSSAEFHNAQMDDAALNAHFAAGKTYDYFLQPFLGRDGWDGSHSLLTLYIHYGTNHNNAYWKQTDHYIYMGDGDGTNFGPITDVDVTAHEFGHAIYDDEVGYNHVGEPGAIEEGLSDIWAACVETYASLPNHNPWIMGDNWEFDNENRNMADPDAAPFHYHNTPYQTASYPDVYNVGNWYTGSVNDLYVHVNSTVMSHWFFLLSQGRYGSNSRGLCYRVLPIGITDAAKIVYIMEKYWLTTSSTFTDVKNYTIYVAENLFGQNSFQVAQVKNAWNAVGIGSSEYKILGPTLICSPNTASYSIYLPVGSTIDWTPGPNIQQNSSDNSNPCVFSFSGQGFSYIDATINYGCGNFSAVRCYIWIGTPIVNYVTGPYSGEPYNMYYFTAYPHSWDAPAQATYYWNASPWAEIYPDYSGANITFYESVGHQVWVYASNSCGSSNTAYTWIEIGSGGYFSINPNPGSTEITVELNALGPLNLKSFETFNEISIFNIYGVLQSKRKYYGTKFNIPVHYLKDGTYIVQVKSGKLIMNKQLIIKH